MSQFFPSGGQSIGVSASASVNIGLSYTVLLQRPLGSRSEWVPTPVPQLGVCSEVLLGTASAPSVVLTSFTPSFLPDVASTLRDVLGVVSNLQAHFCFQR